MPREVRVVHLPEEMAETGEGEAGGLWGVRFFLDVFAMVTVVTV